MLAILFIHISQPLQMMSHEAGLGGALGGLAKARKAAGARRVLAESNMSSKAHKSFPAWAVKPRTLESINSFSMFRDLFAMLIPHGPDAGTGGGGRGDGQ